MQKLVAASVFLAVSSGVALPTALRAQDEPKLPYNPSPAVKQLSTRTERFENTGCEATGTCGLKEFSLRVDQYRVDYRSGMKNFGTRIFARYETQSIPELEKFGMAQFIRGCQFTSARVGSAIVNKLEIEIPFRDGSTVPYHFPNWTIDGPSPDPIDWGFEPHEFTRHFFYKWNEVAGSLDPATWHNFGERAPTNPALYVRDLPGTAFYDPKTGKARNISLAFRTCIYPSAKVPRKVEPGDVSFAEPLKCFDWTSSWVYDHAAGRMESPQGIHPVCQ
jgi:hypothetical protein